MLDGKKTPPVSQSPSQDVEFGYTTPLPAMPVPAMRQVSDSSTASTGSSGPGTPGRSSAFSNKAKGAFSPARPSLVVSSPPRPVVKDSPPRTVGVTQVAVPPASSSSFSIVDVPGDGNCFFHAMSDQLAQEGVLDPTGVPYTHEVLRGCVASYVTGRADLEAFFVDRELAELWTPGGWVGHPVIQPLANLLGIQIQIIRVDGVENPDPILPQGGVATGKIVRISYDGTHYNSARNSVVGSMASGSGESMDSVGGLFGMRLPPKLQTTASPLGSGLSSVSMSLWSASQGTDSPDNIDVQELRNFNPSPAKRSKSRASPMGSPLACLSPRSGDSPVMPSPPAKAMGKKFRDKAGSFTAPSPSPTSGDVPRSTHFDKIDGFQYKFEYRT